MTIRFGTKVPVFLMTVFMVSLFTSCFDMPPRNEPPTAPPISSDQPAIRNTELETSIIWVYEYTPADSNAAEVWSSESGPNLFRAELNRLGVEDHNTFVAPKLGRGGILQMMVHQYTNGQAGDDYGCSLRVEMWLLPSQDRVCNLRTDSYRYDRAAVTVAAEKIYYYLHMGWR